jgi:carbohydrate kinase (thermoresistant glucokinase family)
MQTAPLLPPAGSPEPTGVEAAETAAAEKVGAAVIVLMGVSGCGKSTVALELRRLLGWQFKEGDDLHPPANVEKMRAGHPLSDADRWPWLHRVAQWIDDRLAAGEAGIITCSNLKRAYRRITIGDRKGVILVYLQAEESVIAARVAQRRHRYMPAALLHSQFEALEEPAAEEHAVVVSVTSSLTDTVIDLLRKVAAAQADIDRAG